MNSEIQEYRGKQVIIRFDGAKCIHSRNCVLGNPYVFVANAPGAWIQPDAATPEAIAALATACPSGAITYERLDGGEQEQVPSINVVRVRENGPLAVQAEMEIHDQGNCYRATLCRCGASKNKPFCDGNHSAVNFVATGEPVGTDSQPLVERAGKLSITPLKRWTFARCGQS